MKKAGRVLLNGKFVKFRESGRPLKRHYGYTRRGQEIVISKGLTPRKRLEIAIHELLHEECWHLDEEEVLRAGKEMAEALLEMEIVSLPDTPLRIKAA